MAFGAGWLLVSLIPPSAAEHQLAARTTDLAAAHLGRPDEEAHPAACDAR